LPDPQTQDIKTRQIAQKIKERRDESRKWMDDNVYGELAEVFLAINCKTRPIMVKDGKGNNVEDITRTNVSMPILSLVQRKNTARLTANDPDITYRSKNDVLNAKLNAWSYMQFDRSGEKREHRRHVMQAETFGYSYTKLFWKMISKTRQFRRNPETFIDRAAILKEQGVSDEDIQTAVSQLGPQLSPDEIAQNGARYGKRGIPITQQITKYDGPVVKCIFVGDFFMPPGVYCLNDSDHWIEQYDVDDRFFQEKAKVQYEDKETHQLVNAFDTKIMQEALESNWQDYGREGQANDLRNKLRDVLNQTKPDQTTGYRRLLGKKKFEVMENHELEDDGRLWITYVVNEKYQIGRMPYEWDFDGRPVYTELLSLPDIISAYATSTPRLMRFLHKLHNAAVGQRTDLTNNLLRRSVLTQYEDDLADEVIERGNFRVYRVKDPKAIIFPQEPDVPGSAWEQEAQILRMESYCEPSLNTTDAGTASNPNAGKLATTAIINQKANDSLTQFKVEEQNYYLKEIGEKKLAMLQEFQDDPIKVPIRYAKQNAETFPDMSELEIDPIEELQEEIEVEPTAGSMLSVDDEFRRGAAVEFFQAAVANPDVFDKRYAAENLVSTMKGIDKSKALKPIPTGPPPMDVRVNVNFSGKIEDTPADIINQVLPMAGIQPSEELAHRDTLKGVKQLSEASDAAANLSSPPQPDPEEKELNAIAKRKGLA
jgi:hypothetical protein